MTPTEWLDAEVGRVSRTAAHFGRTASAVSQWKTNGVPVSLMREFHEWTQGAVSLAEMLAARPVERAEN